MGWQLNQLNNYTVMWLWNPAALKWSSTKRIVHTLSFVGYKSPFLRVITVSFPDKKGNFHFSQGFTCVSKVCLAVPCDVHCIIFNTVLLILTHNPLKNPKQNNEGDPKEPMDKDSASKITLRNAGREGTVNQPTWSSWAIGKNSCIAGQRNHQYIYWA